MKKILGIIIALVLLLCTGVVAFASYEDVPEYIRIGIRTDSVGSTYQAAFDDGFSIYHISNGIVNVKEAYDVNNVTIENKGNMINIYDNDFVGENGESALICSFDSRSGYFIGCYDIDGGTMRVSGLAYRGGIMLYNTGSGLNFINVVNGEEYLYGVVSREMSASYPIEALKAQAVAARSFAAKSMGKHNSQGYDVCNTQCCQVYGGIASESAKCTSAVNDTSGVLAYYKGAPVACYYSANNGGYIESSKDIWGNEAGYLQGKKDDYNPKYEWEAEYTPEKLQSVLRDAGYDVGTIKSVKILSKTAGGSVTKLEIVGMKDTAVLDNKNIRSVLGASAVKSLNFKVSYQSEKRKEIEVKEYRKGEIAIDTQKTLSNLTVPDGNGRMTVLTEKSVSLKSGKDKANAKNSSNASKVSEEKDENIILIKGKGFGHGIGMSQQGAKVMAESGLTYDEILSYYYEGITIE